REHACNRRIARLMPISNQASQFIELVALEARVGVMFHERCVGCMEILARSQIANDLSQRSAKGIVPRLEPRCRGVERNAQCFVRRAMALQFLPRARRQWNPVAVVDAAPWNFACD